MIGRRTVREGLLSVTFVLLFGSPAGFAQTQGTPSQGPSGQPSTGRNRTPAADTPQPGQQPGLARPIYLSGSVRLPDGAIPPATVVIERVCGGVIRPEGYTDSSGNFSFMVANQTSGVFLDASVAGDAAIRGDTSTMQRGGNERSLSGCEIRGNLAGFTSSSILLGFRQSTDNPDIGVILIRPIANVEGYTFSITTARASKDARKAYEKGIDGVKKQRWAEAERDFSKAVQVYPEYAIAWFELGRVYHQQKKFDEAKHAYHQAVQIDSKFISPYAQLITLNANQQKWADVEKDFSQLLRLNPYVGADLYFYGAVANYNLKKVDVAERHAREAAKLDTDHKIPKINHLLGVILAEKRDYGAARENIEIYLKLRPNAPDTEAIKQLLADIEKNVAVQ
jgi:tetratricopeptide (TPR) repeat protein